MDWDQDVFITSRWESTKQREEVKGTISNEQGFWNLQLNWNERTKNMKPSYLQNYWRYTLPSVKLNSLSSVRFYNRLTWSQSMAAHKFIILNFFINYVIYEIYLKLLKLFRQNISWYIISKLTIEKLYVLVNCFIAKGNIK